MAFAYTINDSGIPDFIGKKKIVSGTFTNAGGDSGGDISTGLNRIDHMGLTHTGDTVVASAPTCNESFPLSGGDVTIVTVAGADGTWFAVGE